MSKRRKVVIGDWGEQLLKGMDEYYGNPKIKVRGDSIKKKKELMPYGFDEMILKQLFDPITIRSFNYKKAQMNTGYCMKLDLRKFYMPIKPKQRGMSLDIPMYLGLPPISKEKVDELKRYFVGVDPAVSGGDKISNHIIPTYNPDSSSWINKEWIEKLRMDHANEQKIIFKFGEFIGNVCKELDLQHKEVIGVLKEFLDKNIW